VVRAVEEAIRERGPLANGDFKHTRPKGESGWWNWKPANFALNYLWLTGRLAVHSRFHFQKRYDLIERVFPAARDLAPPTPEEFHGWHVRQSLHAMGAATGHRPADVPHLPAAHVGGAKARARNHAALGRGRGDRGRGRPGKLVRARRGPARAGDRGTPARCRAGHHAALPVRFVPVAPRAHQASVRVRLPHRGLHAGSQARPRLLLAPDLPRRTSHRPARRQDPPRRASSRGAQRSFRAVAREGRTAARRGLGRRRA
jgi:hypothetical protein